MRLYQFHKAEQIVAKLPQIEVQLAQGKSLAVPCREAEISEQSCAVQSRLPQGTDPLKLGGVENR